MDVRDRFLRVNVYACEDDLLPGQGIPKLRTVSKKNKSKIRRSKEPRNIEQVLEPAWHGGVFRTEACAPSARH